MRERKSRIDTYGGPVMTEVATTGHLQGLSYSTEIVRSTARVVFEKRLFDSQVRRPDDVERESVCS